MSANVIRPEHVRENLEVALVTLMTVCKRWPDAPLVVLRAIDVADHVLRTGAPQAIDVDEIRSGRYMNQFHKTQEMASWILAKHSRETTPPSGFVGGHGYPDPEIYGWVDKLNGLSRVCTLQSCAGHQCTTESHCGWCDEQSVGTACATKRIEDLGHVMSGQLWLWLEPRMAVWFYQHVSQLAELPCIEKVSVLWHVDGREIVDVVFKGAGTGDLAGSMSQILAFFENGNIACNL